MSLCAQSRSQCRRRVKPEGSTGPATLPIRRNPKRFNLTLLWSRPRPGVSREPHRIHTVSTPYPHPIHTVAACPPPGVPYWRNLLSSSDLHGISLKGPHNLDSSAIWLLNHLWYSYLYSIPASTKAFPAPIVSLARTGTHTDRNSEAIWIDIGRKTGASGTG